MDNFELSILLATENAERFYRSFKFTQYTVGKYFWCPRDSRTRDVQGQINSIIREMAALALSESYTFTTEP